MFHRVVASLCSGALLASPAVAAPPPAPPLTAYGALPAIEEVTLSPDGKRIAFIGVVGEQRTLVVRQMGGEALAAFRVGTTKIRGLQFADADRLLITTSTTDKPFVAGWQMPRTEWFQVHSYDLTAKKLVTVLNRTKSTLNAVAGHPQTVRRSAGPAVLVPGMTLIAPAARMDLYTVDLRTGVGKIASEGFGGRHMDWVFGPDGTLVARTHYAEKRGAWSLDVRESDRWRSIDATSTKIDTPHLLGLGRAPGSIAMYREEDGQESLVEISLKDASVTEVVEGSEVSGVLFHPVTWRLAGVGVVKDSTEYRFFDPVLTRLWAKVTPAFKGKRVSPSSWSDDLNQLIVWTEGVDDPGSYYHVDMTRMKADFIGDAYPGVPGAAIGEVRPLRYKAADGLEIPGYLTLPPGRAAKGLPLVVLPHGGPQSRDSLGFDWWAQALASRGYAVLQPNFRGSSGYGLAFVRAGYGEWGRKMQTDLSDGVRHLAAEGVIDPKRVCIMGGSYGGYAALAGAAIDQGVYRCAVSVNGVSDLRAMLASEAREMGERSVAIRYWNRFMGVEKRSDRALDEVSPARRAAEVTVPVLMIHGRDDTVVPFRQSQLMHDALRKAGKDSTLVTLDGEDHWLSRGETRQRMLKEAVAFVEQHNPPG
jgi:dipeptidyl aminopeptidase/acylaminoacyl peptidase